MTQIYLNKFAGKCVNDGDVVVPEGFKFLTITGTQSVNGLKGQFFRPKAEQVHKDDSFCWSLFSDKGFYSGLGISIPLQDAYHYRLDISGYAHNPFTVTVFSKAINKNFDVESGEKFKLSLPFHVAYSTDDIIGFMVRSLRGGRIDIDHFELVIENNRESRQHPRVKYLVPPTVSSRFVSKLAEIVWNRFKDGSVSITNSIHSACRGHENSDRPIYVLFPELWENDPLNTIFERYPTVTAVPIYAHVNRDVFYIIENGLERVALLSTPCNHIEFYEKVGMGVKIVNNAYHSIHSAVTGVVELVQDETVVINVNGFSVVYEGIKEIGVKQGSLIVAGENIGRAVSFHFQITYHDQEIETLPFLKDLLILNVPKLETTSYDKAISNPNRTIIVERDAIGFNAQPKRYPYAKNSLIVRHLVYGNPPNEAIPSNEKELLAFAKAVADTINESVGVHYWVVGTLDSGHDKITTLLTILSDMTDAIIGTIVGNTVNLAQFYVTSMEDNPDNLPVIVIN